MRIVRRRPTPLEERLAYRFKRPELLELALTHRSWANEQGHPGHYERLEFLGDSVLELVTAEWLYAEMPDVPEGELSKTRATIVSKPPLAEHARRLGLGAELRLGVGEERSGGREKPSLLADSMEAVFGAVYLDGGLDAARRVVRPFLERSRESGDEALPVDAKTRLQELTQGRGLDLPEYRLLGEEGPDHDKTFTVECRIAGAPAGSGRGGTKKLAEQRAAAAALAAFGG